MSPSRETGSSFPEKRKRRPRKRSSLSIAARRNYGRFTRRVELPQSVDPEHVKANYKGGVLTVQLKKPAEAAPKKIPVKSS